MHSASWWRRLVGIALAILACAAPAAGAETFADAGTRAVTTLDHHFNAGRAGWWKCDARCSAADSDWGVDSLTYTLALSAPAHPGTTLRARMAQLAAGAPDWAQRCNPEAFCQGWSDVPAWDTVALAREYTFTHDPATLRKAEAALAFVTGSPAFSLGACPAIRYQQPGGGANELKTLETDANVVKAAVLLADITHRESYVVIAELTYAAIRKNYLDKQLPLYTTYVIDDGLRCAQLPHRFFASVNGDMIWAGVQLARLVPGPTNYLTDARSTARGVEKLLIDGRGVFTDLQAENDVVEPLVEGMLALAQSGDPGARKWILSNAAAARGARTQDGAFGRFFDGPVPAARVTAWQTNGGLALEIAAAALAPRMTIPSAGGWSRAVLHPAQITTPMLPKSITFTGSGIALYGTLGAACCEAGHAQVVIDGRPPTDLTGIWQNKSSLGHPIRGTILFAWRWPPVGRHTITLLAGAPNAKEGGSFLHLTGYRVLGEQQR